MNKLPQRLTLLLSIVAVVIAVLGGSSPGEAAPAFNLVKILGASGGSTAQVSNGRLLVSEGPVKIAGSVPVTGAVASTPGGILATGNCNNNGNSITVTVPN